MHSNCTVWFSWLPLTLLSYFCDKRWHDEFIKKIEGHDFHLIFFIMHQNITILFSSLHLTERQLSNTGCTHICTRLLAIATTNFAEDDIRNISKPVREMTLMKILLAMRSMNVVFNRVSVQEKKQLRKLENKGKALLRAEAAVVFNEIC